MLLLTEEEEKSECHCQEYRLFQRADECQNFEWALRRRYSRPYREIGEDQQSENKEGAYAHCPRESNLRDQMDDHYGEDDTSE